MTPRRPIIGARMILLGAVDPRRLRHYSTPKRLSSTIVYATELTDLFLQLGTKCVLCDVEGEDLCVAWTGAEFSGLLCGGSVSIRRRSFKTLLQSVRCV